MKACPRYTAAVLINALKLDSVKGPCFPTFARVCYLKIASQQRKKAPITRLIWCKDLLRFHPKAPGSPVHHAFEFSLCVCSSGP